MKFRLASLSKGWGFFKLLRLLLIFSTLISIFVTGITIWNETNELEPVLEAMGTVFNPIYTLSTNGQIIAENGLYQANGNFFQNIFGFFVNLYSILEPMVIIYLLLFYLFKLSEVVIIMDNSRKTQSFIVALLLFFGIQLLYVGILTDLPLKTPFVAVGNLGKIIFRIFG